MNTIISSYFEESILVKQATLQNKEYLQSIERVNEILVQAFKDGKKLLLAGNGGSAADAQHFSAEIVGRYKLERRGYPAIALTTDSSILTAWANDYNYETLFSRQLESLAVEGDIFIGISTSGNSKNIVEAVKLAKTIGVISIVLTGNGGGSLAEIADISLVVPSSNTPRIQEVHILTIHAICEEVEKSFEVASHL